MKRLFKSIFKLLIVFILCMLIIPKFSFAADQTIASTEEMVGRGHATKADTLNRAFLVEHDDDGVHEFADGEGMFDSGELEILIYNVVESAVNYLELGNSATNTPVTIKALGDDSNIDMRILPQK